MVSHKPIKKIVISTETQWNGEIYLDRLFILFVVPPTMVKSNCHGDLENTENFLNRLFSTGWCRTNQRKLFLFQLV